MLKNDRTRTEINQRLKMLAHLGEGCDDDALARRIEEVFHREGPSAAEDLLFEEGPDAPAQMLRAGLWLYDALNSYEDKELEALGFVRREVRQGIEDLLGLFGVMPTSEKG